MPYNNNTTPQQAVILFTRYPQAGKVKTRMIERLGPQGAANLHDQLTKQVLNNLNPILQTNQVQLQVCYCGGSEEEVEDWLGKDILLAQQQGNDLGERMQHAFEHSWQQGVNRVLLVGSDCPAITTSIINQGLEQLCIHDLVLGPAMDGGYYLIGLNKYLSKKNTNYACLFHNIDWGSKRVLAQTLEQARENNLSFALLPQLHDIDRPEDLVHLNYHPNPQ